MILLYHLVFPDDAPPDQWTAGYVMRLRDFKKQMRWLNRQFQIVSLEDYLEAEQKERKGLIALTFDDGYRATFDLVQPFLLAAEVPATFFVTTAHLQNRALLWFVYFNALCFERVYQSISIEGQPYPLDSEQGCYRCWRKLVDLARSSGNAIAFSQTYAKEYPLPEAVHQKYLGLSEAQITHCAENPLLTLGGHTHNHPYLDQISYEQQLYEINKNKRIIEDLTQAPVRYFSYTGGVYNADSVSAVKQAGFEAAFAIRPRGFTSEKIYEMPRTDIYSPAVWKLQLKALGLADLARRITQPLRGSHD